MAKIIPYGKVNEDVLLSEAWRKLTKNQINLYLFSLCCCHHPDRPQRDFPIRLKGQKNLFYLSYQSAVDYHVYEGSNPRFYADRKQLIALGFWETVDLYGPSGPGKRRGRTVFRLSDKWRDWREDE